MSHSRDKTKNIFLYFFTQFKLTISIILYNVNILGFIKQLLTGTTNELFLHAMIKLFYRWPLVFRAFFYFLSYHVFTLINCNRLTQFFLEIYYALFPRFPRYYVNSFLVTVINMTYKNLASKCETAVNLLIQIKKVSSTEKKNRNKTTNPSWIKPKSLYSIYSGYQWH